MKKVVKNIIIVLLVLVCVNYNTSSIAYAQKISTKEANHIGIEETADIDIEDMKECTFKFIVPKGTLYICSSDEKNSYKIALTNSKGKAVKTINSTKVKYYGNNVDKYIRISKGTYTVKVTSTTGKKLNGWVSLNMLSNKTFETSVVGELFQTVTESKTYYMDVIIYDGPAQYRILDWVKPYDGEYGKTYVQPGKLLDSDGNVISVFTPENKDSEWLVDLKPGTYTLQIKVNKSGVLRTSLDFGEVKSFTED